MGNKNHAVLIGTIVSGFYRVELGKRTLCVADVAVSRSSGTKDVIPVAFREGTVDTQKDYSGTRAQIDGSFCTTYYRHGDSRRSFSYVYAMRVVPPKQEEDVNRIYLEGDITRIPVKRMSPRKHVITDLRVSTGRTPIPVIFWWENAEKAAQLTEGSHVIITGRIQEHRITRYTKHGGPEQRVLHEVSGYYLQEISVPDPTE